MLAWLKSITPEAATAIATIALAFVTTILAVGTLFLWHTTRRLVIGAEATATRQLRAYLFNDRATIIDFDEIPIVQVLIKNSGQTPAYNVVGWNAVLLAGFPLATELMRPPDADLIRANLGPGMTCHFMTRLDRLTDVRKAAIRSGSAALYVYGEVQYRDIFGKDRALQYRLFYGGDTGTHPRGELALHPGGNTAT